MKFSPYNQRKLKLQNKLKIHKKNTSEEIDSQLGLSAPLWRNRSAEGSTDFEMFPFSGVCRVISSATTVCRNNARASNLWRRRRNGTIWCDVICKGIAFLSFFHGCSDNIVVLPEYIITLRERSISRNWPVVPYHMDRFHIRGQISLVRGFGPMENFLGCTITDHGNGRISSYTQSVNEGDKSAENVPITDNCTQSSGDKILEKNNFHHLDTCSGHKANLSLKEKTAGCSCWDKILCFQ